MRITRVFTDIALEVGSSVVLHPMGSAHLVKVLRLRADAEVILFNGNGQDYRCRIVLPKAEACQLEVLSATIANNESPCEIVLLQGLCRGEKMDWVLEKASELGVAKIIPVHCERSEVHLEKERAEKRRDHWQRVVQSACEQSGRARVPVVEPLLPLEQRLTQAFSEETNIAMYCLHPGGAPLSRTELIANPKPAVALAIGPEGGFSERDLAQLQLAGFKSIQLGARVLRTETAGPVAVALWQGLWGDALI